MALLSGCGGGGGGSTTTSEAPTTPTTPTTPTATVSLSGVAVDGYIKSGMVFLDLNNNGVAEGNEPRAYTNDQGQYTLSGIALLPGQTLSSSQIVLVGGSVLIQNNDGRTNVTENLTITGTGAEGSTVQLYTWTDDALTPDGIVQDSELAVVNGAAVKITNMDGTFAIDIPTAAEGEYKVVARQIDVAGNVSDPSSVYTLVVDSTIATPSVSLVDDSFGGAGTNSDLYTNDASLNFSAVASDVTRAISIDGGPSSPTYTAPTNDGTYTVQVVDTDTAGNTAQSSITFTLDTSATTMMIMGLTNDTAITGTNTDRVTQDMSLNVAGTEADATVMYRVSLDGVNYGPAITAQDYATLADGTYSVQVMQIDKAGNSSAWSTAFTGITKDTLTPEAITFTISDNGVNSTDDVTSNELVTISKANDVATWQYTLNGTDATPMWLTGSGTTFSLGLTDAVFEIGDIQVRGYDAAGNMTSTTSNTTAYRLDKSAPAAAATPIKHYDSNGVEKTGDYVVGDYIEFFFNEQLSAVPTKTAGDSFGNLASFSLSESGTSAFIQLKTSETIDVGDAISLQVIDLVGQQSTIEFTLV